jgi:hypothetical protein
VVASGSRPRKRRSAWAKSTSAKKRWSPRSRSINARADLVVAISAVVACAPSARLREADPAPAPPVAIATPPIDAGADVDAAVAEPEAPSAAELAKLEERFKADPKAAAIAREMFTTWRIVADVENAQTMDGGYRGHIRLEPALPVKAERRHLEWIMLALRDFERFFSELDAASPKAPHAHRYKWRPLALRFTRSIAARTPSAYATGALAEGGEPTVAWNLAGSLHTSPDAVRDTLFHEIFHLNDAAHAPQGETAWSIAALSGPFDSVVHKCGTSIACLAPYSPNDTIVRGGTYYSFQPGNGVREYAAELAVRYYREQRAVLRALPHVKPFKCGPPENAEAWAKLRDEMFDGVDRVPPCP